MAERYVINEIGRALSASATKTMVQLVSPSTLRPIITEFGVSFDSTTSSNPPVKVELIRQTSAGTASAFTPLKMNPSAPASNCSAQVNATAEPTAGDILRSWYITPVGGLWVMQFPLGREPILDVSGRMGIRVVTGTSVTPNCTVYLEFEE